MYAYSEYPTYRNIFGMNEHEEDAFICSKIEQFCKADLHFKNQELYTLLYEFIEDNLEKFLFEVNHEFD